jgi:hypothetical protein
MIPLSHQIKIFMDPECHTKLESRRYKHSFVHGESAIQRNFSSSCDGGKYFFTVKLLSESEGPVNFRDHALMLENAINDGLPLYSDVTYETHSNSEMAIITVKCNLLGLLMDIHRAIRPPSRFPAVSIENPSSGAHLAVHVPSSLLSRTSEQLPQE